MNPWVFAKIGVVLAILFGVTPMLVYLERRISAFIQGRLGPNRVDLPVVGRMGGLLPGGLGQALADGIKFIFKEDIIPAKADRFLFVAGPLLVFLPPAIGFCVIPFGNQIGGEKLQVANLPIGILFVMSVLSVGVYGITFGGWASNNKYSLLGGLRASAQLISYELTLGLSILMAIMMSESVDPQAIVAHQVAHGWNIIGGGSLWALPCGLLGFGLLFTTALAENNRLPFDLSECEAELVGGYHTEYSSMKFAMFFMGEYIAMILMSAIMTTLYLGGWHLPVVTRPGDHSWVGGLVSMGVFMGKMLAILFVYIWIRWTLPRFKYNQLMNLGWKVLLPLSLGNVALLAVIGVFLKR